MKDKIAAFFKGFFRNIVADPVSSFFGAVKLASGGAAVYGMTTGSVPVNQATVGFATAAIGSGIHSLGTNSVTGAELPVAIKAEQAVASVSTIAPVAVGIVEQVAAIKAETEAAEQKVSDFRAILAGIAQVLPPAAPERKTE